LEETITYFRDRGPQLGKHQINIDCREQLPAVPLNAELMSWVFENLFKNAMDAIGRRQGEIEVRVQPAADGKSVSVTFQDNGCGITAENIGRVFEPGFSTKKRGWGLGLAFVKRIVEEYHKGKIAIARSTPDEGTVIEINLPLG
jgi:signal transduction histidine kinase